MIIEIEKYGSENLLLVVKDIRSVQIENEYKSGETQYSLVIETDGRTYRIWYNQEKQRAMASYDKIREALKSYYQRDLIKEELQKYLKTINI